VEQVLDFMEFSAWSGRLTHDDLLRVNGVGALETHERIDHGFASLLTRITDSIHIGERLRCHTVEEL
jgi:hypothetical protein